MDKGGQGNIIKVSHQQDQPHYYRFSKKGGPCFWLAKFPQVDYPSACPESLLRIHNIILVLWVVSPKVQSDASMVLETTLRTVEMAMESCRSQGVTCPQELLLWEAWLCFVAFWFGARKSRFQWKANYKTIFIRNRQENMFLIDLGKILTGR